MEGDGPVYIKAISIDSRYVYMGSANFSDAAMGKEEGQQRRVGTIIESNFIRLFLSIL